MTANNDPFTLHDHGQAIRHLGVAKILIERCPVTGQRVGSRRARGNAGYLVNMYTIRTSQNVGWYAEGGAR